MNQLLNEDILLQFRKTVGWVNAQKDWAIDLPVSLSTTKYFNNKKKLLLDRLEDLEWHRACMFSEEDIKDISNLIGLKRGLFETDKCKLAVDRKSLIDAINEINEYDDRWQLLNTCSRRLTQGSKESLMKSPDATTESSNLCSSPTQKSTHSSSRRSRRKESDSWNKYSKRSTTTSRAKTSQTSSPSSAGDSTSSSATSPRIWSRSSKPSSAIRTCRISRNP